MMIDQVATRISRSIDTTTTVNGSDILGINEHLKATLSLFDLNSHESVRVVGIWARGGNGRSALSKFVYQKICEQFQSHCFLGNVKRISQDHHMSHLSKEFVARVRGEGLTRSRFENQKVLLVADNVTKLDQLDALAEDFNRFGPGSLVIVTTQDRQLLTSYGINLIYEVERLRFQRVRELLRELSSRKIDDISDAFGSGSFLRDDDSNFFDGIIKKISKMLFSATPTNGNYLSGIDQHMNRLYPLLDLDSNQGVRVTGIWGRGSIRRLVLAGHVYENILHNFESHCFLEDVSNISLPWRQSHLQKELYSKMEGKGLSAKISHRCLNKKILLVANDVGNIEQLAALAEEFSCFGPGSRIVITTQDRQLLSSSGVKSVYEAELSRTDAFRKRDKPVGLEPMNPPGINCFSALKYIVASLCGGGQLRE